MSLANLISDPPGLGLNVLADFCFVFEGTRTGKDGHVFLVLKST